MHSNLYSCIHTLLSVVIADAKSEFGDVGMVNRESGDVERVNSESGDMERVKSGSTKYNVCHEWSGRCLLSQMPVHA